MGNSIVRQSINQPEPRFTGTIDTSKLDAKLAQQFGSDFDAATDKQISNIVNQTATNLTDTVVLPETNFADITTFANSDAGVNLALSSVAQSNQLFGRLGEQALSVRNAQARIGATAAQNTIRTTDNRLTVFGKSKFVSRDINTSLGNSNATVGGPATRNATVTDTNGVRRFNNLDQGSVDRGFVQNPLSQRSLRETQQSQLQTSLEVKAESVLFDVNGSNALLDGFDGLLLEGQVKGVANLQTDAKSVNAVAGVNARGSFTLATAQGEFLGLEGNTDVSSVAEAGLQGQFTAGKRGVQVGFAGKAEAVALQASGQIKNDEPIDLFGGLITVNEASVGGDLNAGGVGGAINAGFSANNGRIRTTFGAGLTAIIGGRLQLGLDVTVNPEPIQQSFTRLHEQLFGN